MATISTAPAPVFRDYSWRELCERVDADLSKLPIVYEFSNGKTFQDSGANGGFYKP